MRFATECLLLNRLKVSRFTVRKRSTTSIEFFRTERNAIEAAANGASVAIKVCSNIAANLIAFLAFIKFVDAMFSWFGANVDAEFVSFEWLLGKAFIPIAAMMGVEWRDCEKVRHLQRPIYVKICVLLQQYLVFASTRTSHVHFASHAAPTLCA